MKHLFGEINFDFETWNPPVPIRLEMKRIQHLTGNQFGLWKIWIVTILGKKLHYKLHFLSKQFIKCWLVVSNLSTFHKNTIGRYLIRSKMLNHRQAVEPTTRNSHQTAIVLSKWNTRFVFILLTWCNSFRKTDNLEPLYTLQRSTRTIVLYGRLASFKVCVDKTCNNCWYLRI